jgi:hypothetical protein
VDREESSTPVNQDIISRALLKAAELVGGLTPLQLYLRVDRSELFRWLVGKGVPPEQVFLRVVEILLDPEAAQLAVIEHRRRAEDASPGDDLPPPE